MKIMLDMMMVNGDVKTVQLKGVQYLARPVKDVLFELPVGHELKLEAEPSNAYDPNAIRVIWDRAFIGYIPKTYTKSVKVEDVKTVLVKSVDRSSNQKDLTKEETMKEAKKEAKISIDAAAFANSDVIEVYAAVPGVEEKLCFAKTEDGAREPVVKPQYRARALYDLNTNQFVSTKRFFYAFDKVTKKHGWKWSDHASLLAFQRVQPSGAYMDVEYLDNINGVKMGSTGNEQGMYSIMLSLIRRQIHDILGGDEGAFRVVNQDYLSKFIGEQEEANADEVAAYMSMA